MQTAITMQTIFGWILTAGVVLFLLWWKFRPIRMDRTTHGTAAWGGTEVKDTLKEGVIPLGRDPDTDELLFCPKRTVHMAVFAPTGVGKGTGYIQPILLTYPGSVVVLDIKGEARDLTIRRRQQISDVYVLEPYGQGSHKFNPLDMVQNLDDASALAEALVMRNPQGEAEPHWLDKGEEWLTGLIGLCAAISPPEERSLNTVREFLNDVTKPAAQLIKLGGLYARYGHTILNAAEKERSGITSTCVRCLSWMDSDAMDAAMKQSTFPLTRLIEGKPCTVYVILPPEHLQAKIRWVRLVKTCVIRTLARQKHNRELLMLIDEAGQLQHMPALSQGLTLMRSYGLRLWLFFQSFEQIKQTFGEHTNVVLDNCSKLFFGTGSLETAKYLSEYLGAYTAIIASHSANTGTSKSTNEYGLPSGSVTNSENVSLSAHKREILTPDEVLTLPRRAVIALLQGCPPILVRLLEWYREPHLRSLQKGGG